MRKISRKRVFAFILSLLMALSSFSMMPMDVLADEIPIYSTDKNDLVLDGNTFASSSELSIFLSPMYAQAQPSETIQFVVRVDCVYDEAQNDVMWTVYNNLSISTFITDDGLLIIADDELASEVYIVATLTEDREVTATAKVAISHIQPPNLATLVFSSLAPNSFEIQELFTQASDSIGLRIALGTLLPNPTPIPVIDEDQLRFALINNPAGTIVLMDNIHLQNPWIPIENFRGTLDGNGFKITGLRIRETSDSQNNAHTLQNTGFFRTVQNVTIRNLHIELANINTNAAIDSSNGPSTAAIFKQWAGTTPSSRPPTNAGALIGRSTGNVVIENVSVTGGSIVAWAGRNTRMARAYAGAFIGEVGGGDVSIIKSHAASNIYTRARNGGAATNAYASAGGMIGRVSGGSVRIIDSYAGNENVEIHAHARYSGTAPGTGHGRAGGLVGERGGGTLVIQNSYVNYRFDSALSPTHSNNQIRVYATSVAANTGTRNLGHFVGMGGTTGVPQQSFTRDEILQIPQGQLELRGWDFGALWSMSESNPSVPIHNRPPHFIITFRTSTKPYFYTGQLPVNLWESLSGDMMVFYSDGLAGYRNITNNVALLPVSSSNNILTVQLVYERSSSENIVAEMEFDLLDAYVPPPILTSIFVYAPPVKLDYISGERFDPFGLVVRAEFDNSALQIIGNDMLTFLPDGPLQPSDSEILISYMGAEVVIPINVELATVATPRSSHEDGVVIYGDEIWIWSDTLDAVVRYTLDLSEPNEQSPIFEGLYITEDTIVRTRAFHPDMSPSQIAEFNLKIAPGIILSFTSDWVHSVEIGGYSMTTIHAVTVTNPVAVPTGEITVGVYKLDDEGEQVPCSDFVLSHTSISNLNQNVSESFTITPRLGLEAGEYTAFVLVGGENIDTRGIELDFAIIFYAVTDETVDISEIQGISLPSANETPAKAIRETAQYTGSVEWYPNDAIFNYYTQYTATITLSSKPSFTFAGVPSDFFTVQGATTVTNDANRGVIIATFPATEAKTIDISELQGVQPPVMGNVPVSQIIETPQFTGAVTWNPDNSLFSGGTVYSATITLTAKIGYTFDGIPADFFAVDGAETTNAKDNGIVIAIFPISPTVYTVTFNLNGGTHTGGGSLVQTIIYGNHAIAPTVARDGYSFRGWNVSFNNITNNLEVVAQWTGAINPVTHIAIESTVAEIGRFGAWHSFVATVYPTSATNRTISWAIDGAPIFGNVHFFASAGEVTVTATITDGIAVGIDYIQEFDFVIANAVIRNESELRDLLFGGSGSDLYYALDANILLTQSWMPVNDFRGTFNGRGHVIENFHVNEITDLGSYNRPRAVSRWSNILEDNHGVYASMTVQHAGLFGWISADNVVIKKLGIHVGDAGISATLINEGSPSRTYIDFLGAGN
jgi:hypothetical protein